MLLIVEKIEKPPIIIPINPTIIASSKKFFFMCAVLLFFWYYVWLVLKKFSIDRVPNIASSNLTVSVA